MLAVDLRCQRRAEAEFGDLVAGAGPPEVDLLGRVLGAGQDEGAPEDGHGERDGAPVLADVAEADGCAGGVGGVEEDGGEEDQDSDNLLDVCPDWEIVENEWLVFARDRKWEWDTELDCPALRYWEPGVEVSWTLGDGEVPLRSSDIV